MSSPPLTDEQRARAADEAARQVTDTLRAQRGAMARRRILRCAPRLETA